MDSKMKALVLLAILALSPLAFTSDKPQPNAPCPTTCPGAKPCMCLPGDFPPLRA